MLRGQVRKEAQFIYVRHQSANIPERLLQEKKIWESTVRTRCAGGEDCTKRGDLFAAEIAGESKRASKQQSLCKPERLSFGRGPNSARSGPPSAPHCC